MDIEYRQKQKSKWQGFLVVVILTILTGTGAVGFKMAGRRLKENTYEAYIDAAEDFSVIDPMECIKYYANAAALNPKEGTAYENILNFYMWRNNEERGICDFSIEEEQNIRKVLGISGNAKRSNETYFKENKEAYERFAYKLGLAYFYSYDGTGNKATSRKWLKIAADAEADMKNGLSEDEIQRACDLYKIADYYDSLGVRNQAGDAMISYSDYWDDLVQMSENSGKDRAVNALLAYKEMTAQIVMNASYFKSAGISEGQMKRQLLRILGELERLEINAGDANADYEREMKMELKRAAELAEQTVFSTFNSANLEENVRKNEENGRNSKND